MPQMSLFVVANCNARTLSADNGLLDIQLSSRNSLVGLYMASCLALNGLMSLGELVIITLGGLLLLIAGFKFAKKSFSDTARRERRRRRSNAPISTKANRPMVKFSVKTKKERRK